MARGVAVRPSAAARRAGLALDPISTAKLEETLIELKADHHRRRRTTWARRRGSELHRLHVPGPPDRVRRRNSCSPTRAAAPPGLCDGAVRLGSKGQRSLITAPGEANAQSLRGHGGVDAPVHPGGPGHSRASLVGLFPPADQSSPTRNRDGGNADGDPLRRHGRAAPPDPSVCTDAAVDRSVAASWSARQVLPREGRTVPDEWTVSGLAVQRPGSQEAVATGTWCDRYHVDVVTRVNRPPSAEAEIKMSMDARWAVGARRAEAGDADGYPPPSGQPGGTPAPGGSPPAAGLHEGVS